MRTGLLATGFLTAAVALGCSRGPQGPPADAPPPVVTVGSPVVRPVTEFTDLTGTLAAVKSADIRPRVSGYVQKVFFTDGAEVKAGDKLVLIDPQPFESARNKAQADIRTSEAQVKLAAATEARLGRVRGSGAVSAEEYDQAVAQLDVAKAGLASAQAALRRAELDLSYTTVTAPFDGRLDRIFVNEGNVVTGGTGQGTVLTRIVTVDPVYGYFTVGEQAVLEYLRRAVREGRTGSASENKVPVEIQLRDEQGYPHQGVLDFAAAELNPATGSLQLRGVFANPGPPRLLRPGLYVRGRIPGVVRTEAVLIPDAAVGTDQAAKVVYVVGPDNRVAVKPVSIGPLSDGLRVIDKGLAPTDRVIVRGLQRVQPGMLVDPQPAPDAPK